MLLQGGKINKNKQTKKKNLELIKQTSKQTRFKKGFAQMFKKLKGDVDKVIAQHHK